MKAEDIHALSLIGLLTLAEFDPIEFKRSTDFSKFEIETKIQGFLENSEDDDVKRLYYEFKNVQRYAQSQDDLSFLLKRLHMIAFQKAHHLSLIFSRENKQLSEKEHFLNIDSVIQYKEDNIALEHDSFLKLAVMSLLKDLKGYSPLFNYRLKNIEIDCLLEPKNKEFPFIIIEGKRTIRSIKQLENAFNQLNKYTNFWGKNSIGLIITQKSEILRQVYKSEKLYKNNFYIILFDFENNQLFGQDLLRFQEEFINRYVNGDI